MKYLVPLIILGSLIGSLLGASEPRTIPPLFKDYGRHHWKISTKYELAQRYFDQAMMLMYNFNHAEAVRFFQAVSQLDPQCAMAHWGVAYAYGPNINAPMFPQSAQPAWEALQRAQALAAHASEKERALIQALAARYAHQPPEDRASLDRAFAEAMRQVARLYPEDNDIQTLFAESQMVTSPWNYWTVEKQLKPSAREAVEAIETVLARTKGKGHPGADHLYIHLVEAGPLPDRGVPSADRLAKLGLAAGHLVHMPSHIYLRVGRYHDASSINEKAIEADEDYLSRRKPEGLYPGGYYPHNIHFYWYATELEGRSRDSLKAAHKLARYTQDLRCGAVEGPRQRYVPLLTNLRFGRWEEVLRAPSPAAEYLFDRAIWHYARGMALAAQGWASEAKAEHSKLVELEQNPAVQILDNPYFPGTKILAVAHQVLAGKAAMAGGDTTQGLKHLRRGVELEDAMPYMEPPFWFHSVRQTLGAALLKAGKPIEAEAVFREDLKNLRHNGWALNGLEQSLRIQGDNKAADEAARQFRRAWRYADVKLNLAWY